MGRLKLNEDSSQIMIVQTCFSILVKSLIIITIYGLSLSSLSAQECVPWDSRYINRTDIKVGDIKIISSDVFDLARKKENKLIHHFANKVHIQTKVSTIRNQLLFTPGDVFNINKVLETERNIRKQRYIKDVQVTPVELCGNQVNILVKTVDNWTLTPGVSFSRSGGNNRSGIGIQEHNLFGYGKSLSFNFKKNEKRTTKEFYYKDPQIFGSRKTFSINLQDNTDGKGYELNLGLPFYEQESKKAWGIKTSKLEQTTSLYHNGKIVNKIREENQQHSAYYGWSKKKQNNSISRFKVGWNFDKTHFLKSTNQIRLPSSLKESYPWFEFNSQVEKYITKTNFKTMGRIEDISLGRSLTLGIGLLNKKLGSKDNQLKLSLAYTKGYELDQNNLTFFTAKTESYLGKGHRQGSTVSLNTEYNHFNQNSNDLLMRVSVKASDNLKFNKQILLGADTGLRGYPIAYQTGNKSLLLQAEKRIHFKKYPLHLMKFGAVFFTDMGTSWGKGNDPKLLADIGVGLRLIPTRSSTGKVLHIDLSIPLVDRDKVDKLQFSIKTSTTF